MGSDSGSRAGRRLLPKRVLKRFFNYYARGGIDEAPERDHIVTKFDKNLKRIKLCAKTGGDYRGHQCVRHRMPRVTSMSVYAMVRRM